MLENLIAPLMILFLIASLVIIPWFLHMVMRKIRDPVPFRLPLCLSVLVLLVMGMVQGNVPTPGENSTVTTIIAWIMLLLLLISLAAMTPYFWFGERIRFSRPWLVFSLFSFMGVVLWLFTTLGEYRVGGPFPPFFPALPLTGWLFDRITSMLHLEGMVYSADLPVYPVLLNAGLYLEIFIITLLFCFVLSRVSGTKET
jgi:hypothetical protein